MWIKKSRLTVEEYKKWKAEMQKIYGMTFIKGGK